MAEALAYFDTSVLINRYLEEPGSAYARRLMRRYHLLSSVITPVEAVSAVARLYRAGEVKRTHLTRSSPACTPTASTGTWSSSARGCWKPPNG